MSVTIKDFGHNMECENLLELKKNLCELYTNQSISIVAKKVVHYVNVLNDGSLIGTYTDLPVDLKSFF